MFEVLINVGVSAQGSDMVVRAELLELPSPPPPNYNSIKTLIFLGVSAQEAATDITGTYLVTFYSLVYYIYSKKNRFSMHFSLCCSSEPYTQINCSNVGNKQVLWDILWIGQYTQTMESCNKQFAVIKNTGTSVPFNMLTTTKENYASKLSSTAFSKINPMQVRILCCCCFRSPGRMPCPNYEAVEFQPRTVDNSAP